MVDILSTTDPFHVVNIPHSRGNILHLGGDRPFIPRPCRVIPGAGFHVFLGRFHLEIFFLPFRLPHGVRILFNLRISARSVKFLFPGFGFRIPWIFHIGFGFRMPRIFRIGFGIIFILPGRSFGRFPRFILLETLKRCLFWSGSFCFLRNNFLFSAPPCDECKYGEKKYQNHQAPGPEQGADPECEWPPVLETVFLRCSVPVGDNVLQHVAHVVGDLEIKFPLTLGSVTAGGAVVRPPAHLTGPFRERDILPVLAVVADAE